jgi:LysM repeat protein
MPRSLSRWLAPLALLVSLLAVLIVISGSTGDEDGESGSSPTTEERQEARRGSATGTGSGETTGRTSTTSRRRTYTVKPGDTLALISERTGVTVEELLELNEDIDPNSLTVGDRIRLSE